MRFAQRGRLVVAGLLALCLVAAAAAEIHQGKIVEATGQKMVIVDSDGDTEEFAVPAGTKITLDGKKADLGDLQAGFRVRVSFDGAGGKQTASMIERTTE